MTDAPARLTTILSDRYRIERELGRGGMATVYLAHDLRHDRKVAIKVLHPDLAAVLGGDRFLNEIKVTAHLQHPHILALFDSGAADGLLYYVMPHVAGESLRQRLVRERQLPIAEAVRLTREVAEALVALAEGLAGLRDELAGSVMLVFQPAEERVTGAKAMLAAGLFGREKPVAIYAVHTAPLPVGQLGTRPGGLMAALDMLTVTVPGAGGGDAIADSVRRIILSVSTTTLPATMQGTAPEDALLAQAVVRSEGGGRVVHGTIASASAEARAEAKRKILAGLAPLGLKVEYDDRVAAGVTNDPGLVERANGAIRGVLGTDATVTVPPAPIVFSEDFGLMQDQVPGVMWFLGVSNAEKGWVGMPHTPRYVADEAAILVAARAMTAVLLDRLRP